ncbi:hypothetical protein WJX72_010925 [[Myrmecia] bisecta]|uniref:RNA-binding S4 domain-containing protein n=1 Tax=[Myrmecia] bisecta TaxID=41462 RepID=A0AAW1QSP6_9CHLO
MAWHHRLAQQGACSPQQSYDRPRRSLGTQATSRSAQVSASTSGETGKDDARALLGPLARQRAPQPAEPAEHAKPAEPAVHVSKAKPRKKQRLDEVCLEQYPEHSRNVIQSWIAQGKVTVNNRPVLKAGTPVADTADICIKAVEPKYVCRAGQKLEAALHQFGIDVSGLVALDAGLSTGGFTDCLLQHGAAHVFGVDVGYGQVAERVRVDTRVTIMERTNLRNLRRADLAFPPQQAQADAQRSQQHPAAADPSQAHAQTDGYVDLVTLDLSFISVLKVLPAVGDVLAPDGRLIILIKPQFEAGRGQVGEGGVIRDPRVHRQVKQAVTEGVEAAGFTFGACMESPIKGAAKGNTEFLAWFQRGA